MFFDSLSQMGQLVRSAQTVLLRLEDGDKIGSETFVLDEFLKDLGAILVEPHDGKILVEQIREILELTTTRQEKDQFFVINKAETLNQYAANCFLKHLEEPKEKYHFILLTKTPEALLPTIRSRAMLYAPRLQNPLECAPNVSQNVLALSKRLLVAKSVEIPQIADEISKKKPELRREFALSVLSTTIELAYKSYFKTKNAVFMSKIEGLMGAYTGIEANGNLKLQLVANLI